MSINYKRLWEELISDCCRVLVDIDNKPKKTIEDEWVKGTLWQVLRKMCSLHKLPPKLQDKVYKTRSLFE